MLGSFNDSMIFFGTGGSATIKHRCVTHLYGSNAMERDASCRCFSKGKHYIIQAVRNYHKFLALATSDLLPATKAIRPHE